MHAQYPASTADNAGFLAQHGLCQYGEVYLGLMQESGMILAICWPIATLKESASPRALAAGGSNLHVAIDALPPTL